LTAALFHTEWNKVFQNEAERTGKEGAESFICAMSAIITGWEGFFLHFPQETSDF
jgi:hypothetical protein